MSHRNKLLNLLNEYECESIEKQEIKNNIKNFIINNENCFLRTNLNGHITASAFLIGPDKVSVLLTHHKQINRWLQLGGHADGDSDIIRVAKKEAIEESGIQSVYMEKKQVFDIDIHMIEEYKSVPKHYHYDVKFLLNSDSFEYKISEESNDLKWVKIIDIINSDIYCENIINMSKKYVKMFPNYFY